MIAREPHLEKYRNGMEPGLDNPLGARALYIHENGVDTLYRVHGTNEPRSIGKSMSSGCIRMINQDVIHLYEPGAHARTDPGPARQQATGLNRLQRGAG